jgi:hypothetical protein
MDKEQLEQLIYQAFEEGFYAGFMSEGNGWTRAELETDWHEYRVKLAQELGW